MIFPEIPHVESRYAGYTRGLRKLEAHQSAMIFASVAIDSPTRELSDRLLTYEVPPHLASEVFVGSQVLVPLGNQNLPGYVVSLHNAAQEDQQFKIKPITEIFESEPLFDKRYVELLYWIADYYAAGIAEVIAAAVPADLGTRVKRVVTLAQDKQPDPSDVYASKIIAVLRQAKGGKLAVKALKQRSGLPQNKFYASLAQLRQSKVVSIEREGSAKVVPKMVQLVALGSCAPTTAKQEEIVSAVKRGGGSLPMPALLKAAGTTAATVKRMCAAGMLALTTDEVYRDPLVNLIGSKSRSAPIPELTEHQRFAFETLRADLLLHLIPPSSSSGSERALPACEAKVPWLLHGVTGSGKTEIYLRLIEETLKHGRTALMLVPEISLTPQLAQRLVGRFGDLVAVWHSALSAGERFDTWRRLRAGQARVLLGARSAVLANVPDVGLIILDEEHDGSYKQNNPSPRYHAKTVAIERARRFGALVLLGSATPDVAAYKECKEAGKVVELPERVFQQALPKSVLVDMRQEYALGNRSIFSHQLKEAIDERLRKQQQVILLINRRGYASQVFCRACGFITKCKHCSVSLVFHQINRAWQAQEQQFAPGINPRQLSSPFAKVSDHSETPRGYLMCHHCGFRCALWETCPACQSPFIKQLGLGTQRVEEDLKELFPTARILRLDSDTTSRKGAYEEIFDSFTAGQADILIGTQIVAKGLDIPRVTLVGVLAADSAFNLPDYRSCERGFQLLTQVSGRAGRGHDEGLVILQTFSQDLPALRLAQQQDYLSFVEQELQSRATFEYPPFSQVLRVVVAGEAESEVEYACELLAEELSVHLDDKFSEEQVKIVGPAPCLITRLRGKYRHHLIVKNLAGENGRKAITDFLRTRQSTGSLNLAVDVDALDLV